MFNSNVNNKQYLSPNLKALRIWGMLERQGFVQIFFYFFFYYALFYCVTQCIELWILRNKQDEALKNLSYTLLCVVSYVKAGTFHIWKKKWKQIINYVSEIEWNQNAKDNDKTNSINKTCIKYARFITYMYWCLVVSTVIVVGLAPILAGFLPSESRERILSGNDSYPEIMSSWVPFDKSRGVGYMATLIIQGSVYVWGGGLVAFYDTAAFVVMIFFAGQFQILKVNCDRIFENGTIESALERIKDCHQHHNSLIKHCKLLNSLLSPVLFMYVVVCSIMLCAAAIRLTSEASGIGQKIWLAEYLLALVFQLFLYCWHSSEVCFKSRDVEYGVVSSAWWQADPKLYRSLLLLQGKLRKDIVFTAGPFTNLDVNTFISIIKGSYSYYTLVRDVSTP